MVRLSCHQCNQIMILTPFSIVYLLPSKNTHFLTYVWGKWRDPLLTKFILLWLELSFLSFQLFCYRYHMWCGESLFFIVCSKYQSGSYEPPWDLVYPPMSQLGMLQQQHQQQQHQHDAMCSHNTNPNNMCTHSNAPTATIDGSQRNQTHYRLVRVWAGIYSQDRKTN